MTSSGELNWCRLNRAACCENAWSTSSWPESVHYQMQLEVTTGSKNLKRDVFGGPTWTKQCNRLKNIVKKSNVRFGTMAGAKVVCVGPPKCAQCNSHHHKNHEVLVFSFPHCVILLYCKSMRKSLGAFKHWIDATGNNFALCCGILLQVFVTDAEANLAAVSPCSGYVELWPPQAKKQLALPFSNSRQFEFCLVHAICY